MYAWANQICTSRCTKWPSWRLLQNNLLIASNYLVVGLFMGMPTVVEFSGGADVKNLRSLQSMLCIPSGFGVVTVWQQVLL